MPLFNYICRYCNISYSDKPRTKLWFRTDTCRQCHEEGRDAVRVITKSK